jgi:hypothetical protein
VLDARYHTLHTLHAERLPNVTATVTNLAETDKVLMLRTAENTYLLRRWVNTTKVLEQELVIRLMRVPRFAALLSTH